MEDGGEEYLPHEMETVGNRAELYGSEDSSDNDEDIVTKMVGVVVTTRTMVEVNLVE